MAILHHRPECQGRAGRGCCSHISQRGEKHLFPIWNIYDSVICFKQPIALDFASRNVRRGCVVVSYTRRRKCHESVTSNLVDPEAIWELLQKSYQSESFIFIFRTFQQSATCSNSSWYRMSFAHSITCRLKKSSIQKFLIEYLAFKLHKLKNQDTMYWNCLVSVIILTESGFSRTCTQDIEKWSAYVQNRTSLSVLYNDILIITFSLE